MDKFEEGDIVKLRSGGPRMTVTGFHKATSKFICEWFDGNANKEARYPGSALKTPEIIERAEEELSRRRQQEEAEN